MKENDIHSELASIRSLMERSAKFISLSGLSGVVAGVYALIGAFMGYRIINEEYNVMPIEASHLNDPLVYQPLFSIAIIVLVLSLATVVMLTIRNARQKGENVWNPVSRRLLVNMIIPLLTGGLFILILITHEDYDMIASACLIFYGLSLVSGSHYTFSDVKWLGFCEIILGLLAAAIPAYGLVFWVVGFGLLHIIYGSVMHFKYER